MSFNSDMSSMLTKIWPSAGIDAVFAILIVIKTECKYTTYFAIISLSDEKTDNKLKISVNGTELTATLEDNSSAQALAALLKQGNITVDMNDYGNFEKVGDLPQSLPKNDEKITTY